MENTASVNLPKRLSVGRPRDWGWEYFKVLRMQDLNGRKVLEAICTLCDIKVSPKGERLRNHISKFHPEAAKLHLNDIVAKSSPTPEEKELIAKYFLINTTEEESGALCTLCDTHLAFKSGDGLMDHLFGIHEDILRQSYPAVEVDDTQIVTPLPIEFLPAQSRNWGWEFFNVPLDNEGNRLLDHVTCKMCDIRVSPKIERLRNHLRRYHPEVAGNQSCGNEVDLETPEEKDLIIKYFANADMSSNIASENSHLWTQCGICQLELRSDHRSALIDHLFEQHSDTLENQLTGDSGNDAENELNTIQLQELIDIDMEFPTVKAGRFRNKVWCYFDTTLNENKKIVSANCKICKIQVSPKSERLKTHMNKFHQWDEAEFVEENEESEDENDEPEYHPDSGIPEEEPSNITEDVKPQTAVPNVSTSFTRVGLGRIKTSVWKYFQLVHIEESGKKIKKAQCNLCYQIVSPKVERLRHHIIRYHPDNDSETEDLLLSSDVLPLLDKRKKMEPYTTLDDHVARKPKSKIWEYFKIIYADEKEKRIFRTVCIICQENVSPKVERLRHHFIKFHPETGVVPDEPNPPIVGRSSAGSSGGERPEKKNKGWILKYFESCEDEAFARRDCKICHESVSTLTAELYNHLMNDHSGIVELGRNNDGDDDPLKVESVKPGRKKYSVWKYFKQKKSVNSDDPLKKVDIAFCRICKIQVSPRAHRLSEHLAKHHPKIFMGHLEVTSNIGELSDEDESHDNVSLEAAQVCKVDELHEFGESCEDDFLYNNENDPLDSVEVKQEDMEDVKPNTNSLNLDIRRRQQARLQRLRKMRKGIDGSLCILCQSVVHPKSSSAFASWNESCTTSLCSAFNLDESYREWFAHGKYCNSCQVLVGNIDFTKRSLDNFSRMLRKYQSTFESLLKENHRLTSARSLNRSGDYEKLVERMYNAITSVKDFNDFDESFEQKEPSKSEIQQLKRTHSRGRKKKLKVSPKREKSTKQPKIVQYTSKYGRQCTSVSFVDEDTNCNNEDDFKNSVEIDDDDDDDFIPEADEWEPNADLDPDFTNDEIKKEKSQKRLRMKNKLLLAKMRIVNRFSLAKPKIENRFSLAKPKPKISRLELLKQRIKLGRKARRLNFIRRRRLYSKGEFVLAKSKKILVPNGYRRKTRVRRERYFCSQPNCTFSSFKEVLLEVHIRSRHENDQTPYHCGHPGCGQKFSNSTSYFYHIKRHTSVPDIACDVCHKLFFEKWALKKHKIGVHGKTSWKCSLCGKSFGPEDVIQQTEHEKLHEIKATTQQPFGCVLCDERVFTNSTDLRHHVTYDHNHFSAKCDKCEKVFKSEKILQRHIEFLHCEKNPSPECAECGHISKTKSELVRHLSSHRTDRPFLCAECGNTFKNKGNLRLHMMMHTGEQPFKCKFCPKGFNQSCKLKAHEETHVPTKNYLCDRCCKSFRTARNIYQHKTFHCHGNNEETRTLQSVRRSAKRRKRREPSPCSTDDDQNWSRDKIGGVTSGTSPNNATGESHGDVSFTRASDRERILLAAGNAQEILPINISQEIPRTSFSFPLGSGAIPAYFQGQGRVTHQFYQH